MVASLRKNVMDENAPASAIARLRKTVCTGCGTCTTTAAFSDRGKSRLLMPVGATV